MPDPIVHLNQPVIAGKTGNLHTDDHTSLTTTAAPCAAAKAYIYLSPGTGLQAWYSVRIRTAARA